MVICKTSTVVVVAVRKTGAVVVVVAVRKTGAVVVVRKTKTGGAHLHLRLHLRLRLSDPLEAHYRSNEKFFFNKVCSVLPVLTSEVIKLAPSSLDQKRCYYYGSFRPTSLRMTAARLRRTLHAGDPILRTIADFKNGLNVPLSCQQRRMPRLRDSALVLTWRRTDALVLCIRLKMCKKLSHQVWLDSVQARIVEFATEFVQQAESGDEGAQQRRVWSGDVFCCLDGSGQLGVELRTDSGA